LKCSFPHLPIIKDNKNKFNSAKKRFLCFFIRLYYQISSKCQKFFPGREVIALAKQNAAGLMPIRPDGMVIRKNSDIIKQSQEVISMRKTAKTIRVLAAGLLIAGPVTFAGCCPAGNKTTKSSDTCRLRKQQADPYQVRIKKDLSYLGPGREEKFDLYLPIVTDCKKRFPGIVIIHGGGWRWGDKARPRQVSIGTTLAQNGYICMSINYLLADPNKPSWPQNIYDCKAAVQFLRKNAEPYQIDSKHIGVIGGSAGGHLSAMVGLVGPEAGLEPAAPYKGISSRVQAVVPLYGAFNLLTWQSDKPRVETYLGVTKEQNPRLWELASPVSHISSDDPPFLVIHGTADEVIDYKQSVELHEKLKEEGVQSKLCLIEGGPHSFALQPAGRDLGPLVISFFDKHLKGR
jgi:acetyl esterase/lipase